MKLKFNIFNIIFNRLVKKKRDSDLKYGIDLPIDSKSDNCYVFPSGMYIFKDVASPWSIAFSKSQRRNYFYNSETRCSTYELPMDYAFYAHPRLVFNLNIKKNFFFLIFYIF